MKMATLYAATLLVMFCVTLAVAKQCDRVYPGDDVNWSQFNGSWYGNYHAHDALMDNAVSCYYLHDFMPTDEGFQMNNTEYYRDGSDPTTYTVSMLQERIGVYKLDESVGKVAVPLHAQHGQGNGIGVVIEDLDSLFKKELVYLTDYVNYLIFVMCSSEGEWMIWLKTPQVNPTAATILPALNRLKDYGTSTKLYKSQCDMKLK